MTRNKILISIMVVVVGLLIGYALRYPIFDSTDEIDQTSMQNQEQVQIPPKLLFAVSIDNAPEARPQAGLSQALLVFETLAEGPATRLLAFYSERQDVEKIGPVRSARPYFLDWAEGFDVPFAHSGGSKEALEEISSSPSIKDINEFYNEKYFSRDRTKPGPHNLFTSSKLIRELIEKRSWKPVSLSFLRPARPKPGEGGKQESRLDSGSEAGMTIELADEITINFSTPLFKVRYSYDQASKSYQRFLADKPHTEALNNEQITTKNVVVLHTTSTLLDEKLLTIDLVTLGSGRAIIFRDGVVLQARWRKQNSQSPLELLDADGSQVALNPGPVWFEVLDQRGSVDWQ